MTINLKSISHVADVFVFDRLQKYFSNNCERIEVSTLVDVGCGLWLLLTVKRPVLLAASHCHTCSQKSLGHGQYSLCHASLHYSPFRPSNHCLNIAHRCL